jgi:drug/metabolite transporter (DMT)-like permease
LVYLGAREAGTWRFVTIASCTAGLLQLVSRGIHCRELRTALLFPWRLWAGPLVCFVVYGLAWPWALAAATPRQAGGVNLINYLWPILTVVFSAWWVPGFRLTGRIRAALVLAVAGLVCANATALHAWFWGSADKPGADTAQWLPFGLAAVAAVTWAVYSALLARWRSWAGKYVTSPVGFMVVGLIGWIILKSGGKRTTDLSSAGVLMTLVYGVGPLAAGYLLWELALARAKIHALSMIAAATPVLSTVFLAICVRRMPGLELVTAALLISAGVAFSMRDPQRPQL